MNLATQILLYGKPFRITDFFRMGQVGWHWQIDDPLKRVGIPYEWVDTAGTTPTTAVGQGIGLLLGREYGGATGPSLLANGATGLTGTATAASYSTTTFAGSVSRAGDASNQSWVTWTGLTTSAVHRIRITNTGATSLDVRNGGVAGTIVASIAAGASTWVHPATTGGSTSITITATANSTTATFTLGQFAVLPGTHLTQATGTAKPTLSARVNLLLSTGSFAAAAWTRRGTATVGAAAPDGTGELLSGIGALGAGDVFQQQAAVTGAAYKPYVEIWPVSTSGTLVFCNPQGLPYGQWNINMALLSTGQWNVITSSHPAVTVVNNYSGNASLAGVMFYASSGAPLSFYARRPDIRTADDAAKNLPAYQRVGATASDHDTDGFPHFMEGDGTDNCMASVATVDGSATDKVTVVTAVTKNSDAAGGIVLELTTDANSNNGAFYLLWPRSAALNEPASLSRGTGGALAALSANLAAAPKTSVLGAANAIGSDVAQSFVDGVLYATSASDQGTGNYTNATLYVLSRAGASSRFNGRFYGSTGRFGPMGDSERNNLTRWWQKRIGTA